MIFEELKEILYNTTAYSGIFGKIWFLAILPFRIVIVLALQSSNHDSNPIDCSVKETGCQQQCFNEFSGASHSHLWMCQILLATIPLALFVILAGWYQTKFEKYLWLKKKVKKFEGRQKYYANKEVDADDINFKRYMEEMENLPKYKKKMKHIIRQTGVGVEKKGRQGEKSENIYWTPFLELVYLLMKVASIGIEVYFIWYTFQVNGAPTLYEKWSFMEFPFMKVPAFYDCGKDKNLRTKGVDFACNQQFQYGGGSVPCHIPYAPEKTMFLRIMNWTTLVSIVLTLLEIGNFLFSLVRKYVLKKRLDIMQNKKTPKPTPVIPTEVVDI